MAKTVQNRPNDDFLQILSHELKNPLTNLKLNLELAEIDLKSKNQLLGDNDFLVSSLARGVEQVNFISTLLDKLVNGRTAGSKENSVDLSDIVCKVTDHFSAQLKKSKISIELKLAKNLKGCWLQSDIEQILINLIVNVIKYAPNSQLRIQTRQLGSLALLTFQDTGPGIPQSLQNKIFDKFVKGEKSASGFGLGLYIVKEIIQTNHGRIQLLNSKNKGTKFHIEIPLST